MKLESNYERLKNVLISDKHFNPEKIKEVVKSDMVSVLSSYADVNTDSLVFDIIVDDEGTYFIKLECFAKRLKIFGHLPD